MLPNDSRDILVSISCTTFNHAPYIQKCLQGFLMQKTTFAVEILIHDDASTDNTMELVNEMASLHSNTIHVVAQSENQYSKGVRGMMPRFNFPRARGKYIALCEGDDYWTDPLKLQKQVDFLEGNLDTVLCFHSVAILLPDGEMKTDFLTEVPSNYQHIEMIAEKGNYVHTPSVVFRNVIELYPESLFESPIGDYFLYMMLAQHGVFKKLDDCMAVYRYGVGIWSAEQQYTRSLRTARTQALLAAYFSEQNKGKIADIFVQRIQAFLRRNRTQVERHHIDYLTANTPVASALVGSLVNDLHTSKERIGALQKSQMHSTSLKKIITHVLSRVLNRITKKTAD